MADFLILAAVAAIVGAAALYVRRAKKSGAKCIGCPEGKSCGCGCPGCGNSV